MGFDPERHHTGLDRILGLALLLLTIGVYWHLQYNGFIFFDDPSYIFENPHVRSGLTAKGFFWAFKSLQVSNWHPLTWLSHMLDCQLFGLNPAGHHLMAIFFHAANALLLFLFLQEATGRLWEGFIVSALFALHPLHVESVAWASERKDILCAFFWFLASIAYVRYAVQRKLSWYIQCILYFALGLLSKPMIVTFPFTLILLDFWPLGRIKLPAQRHSCDTGANPTHPSFLTAFKRRLILEKIPFFIMAAAASVVTLVAQSEGGAVQPLEIFSIKIRILNALLSYMNYALKMLWPHDLAVLYVHPGNALHAGQAIMPLLLILFLSALAVRRAVSQPYLLVGWLWYLGTLVPVIGLVQVGAQSMADRYTYIPLIGLFIALVYGLSDTFDTLKVRLFFRALLVATCLGALALLTWFQIGYWKNSLTLFEHTLKVAGETAQFHYVVALEDEERGNEVEARFHYERAMKLNPAFMAQMFNATGYRLAEAKDFKEAASYFRKALEARSDYSNAHNNLGVVLGKMRCLDNAIDEFSEALKLSPGYSQARTNLDNALKDKAAGSDSKGTKKDGCP